MAEMVDGGGGRGKKGGSKQKKKSTRIDMTAMVDVAFLLLTFFILTTTMATPSAMELNVPPKPKDDMKEEDINKDVKASKVLTLILGKNDKVHWYIGIEDPVINTTDFSDQGVRKVIVDHVFETAKKKGQPLCKGDLTQGCWDPIIVVKPNITSKYRNVVDILDEMSITNAPKYALTKITPQDSTLLADQGKE